MTGNKNAWRAPLAGLASVAMIATMGVAASTANADSFDVNEAPTDRSYETVIVHAGGHALMVNGKQINGNETATVYVPLEGKLSDTKVSIKDFGGDNYVPASWTVTGEENQVLGDMKDITLDEFMSRALTDSTNSQVQAWTYNLTPTYEVSASVKVGFALPNGKTVWRGTNKKGFVQDVPAVSNDRFGGWYIEASAAKAAIDNFDAALASEDLIPADANFDEIEKDDTTSTVAYYFVDSEKFGGLVFTSTVTVTAFVNDKARTVKVTFDYGSWKGAPKDVKVKAKQNEAIAVPSEKPAREGYLFRGWQVVETGKVYNANTMLAGDVDTNKDREVTMVAVWAKPGKADAEAALNELTAVSFTANGKTFTADDKDAAAFTSASWDEYTEAYKKAMNEYRQANWSKMNGSVSEEAAASIIAELNEGRKALRFNTGSVDTTIDGSKRSASGAELVYRLATPDGARHFMTADENEVLARTGKLNGNILHVTQGQGGWTLESASTFRMVSEGAHASDVVDAGTPSKDYGYEYDTLTKDGTGLLALTKTVTRLYNPANQEHLYTADAHEVLVLTRDHGWSVDSAAANLYTPALYTTDTEVARFYNPATGLHFYTTDKAEINFWTVQHPGIWQKESTGIYAL